MALLTGIGKKRTIAVLPEKAETRTCRGDVYSLPTELEVRVICNVMIHVNRAPSLPGKRGSFACPCPCLPPTVSRYRLQTLLGSQASSLIDVAGPSPMR